MRVPLLDLKAQYESIREPLEQAVLETLRSGQWILGPQVEALEKALASRLGVPHAVGVASGTDALLLALRAAGVRPGDDVVLPSYTFFATAGAVVNVGAHPVFAEIEDDSMNLDPSRLEAALTDATRAVIVVHLYGQSAHLEPIAEICARRKIALIEDVAQSVDATYGDRPLGSVGDLGCFSFYPTKNLGCAGDGGLVTTRRDDLADRVRLLRNHGMRPRYVHHEVGWNSRLDSIQAAILTVKLLHLERWTLARATHAAAYDAAFLAVKGLRPPAPSGYGRHVYNQYILRVPEGTRDALRQHLTESAIGTEIYYPVPLHLQPCFESLGYRDGQFPVSEAAARTSLALPIYAEMSAEQREYVIGTVELWMRSRS